MLGIGHRAELACRKKRLRGTGRADLAVLVLLEKRDLRLAAGSGQTQRIDDVRDVVVLGSIAPNWCTAVYWSSLHQKLQANVVTARFGLGEGTWPS